MKSSEELARTLIATCASDPRLSRLTADEVQGFIDILMNEQFAGERLSAQRKLKDHLNEIADRLYDEDKHAN
jgi:hypothetical protein